MDRRNDFQVPHYHICLIGRGLSPSLWEQETASRPSLVSKTLHGFWTLVFRGGSLQVSNSRRLDVHSHSTDQIADGVAGNLQGKSGQWEVSIPDDCLAGLFLAPVTWFSAKFLAWSMQASKGAFLFSLETVVSWCLWEFGKGAAIAIPNF